MYKGILQRESSSFKTLKYVKIFLNPFPLLPSCSQQVWRVFVILFDHTQTHTTVSRTPLDEGSPRRRDLYLTPRKHSQETNIHAPVGIRTHDPSKRSAADLRLRPRGHWYRQIRKNIVSIHLRVYMNLDFAELSKAFHIAVLYLQGRILNHALAVIGFETWFLCL
jgi:hypothetical protein